MEFFILFLRYGDSLLLVILQLPLLLLLHLITFILGIYGVFKELKQNRQEKVEQHKVTNQHSSGEEYNCKSLLVGESKRHRIHCVVPVFSCQHDKHGDHRVDCCVEVVSGLIALLVDHFAMEKLFSNKRVNEHEEELQDSKV